VSAFLAAVDSAAAVGREALATTVSERGVLVGAAVARLLDESIDAGDTTAASGRLSSAERIARLYLDTSGTPTLLDLIDTYRSWGDAERAKRREAKVLERKADGARDAGNFLLAVGFLEKARDLYEGIGDLHSVAVVWGSLGVVHWYAGDMEAVRADYEHALPARRAVDDNILVGKTLNGLGSVHYRSGQLDEAEAFYRQAIELRSRTGDVAGLATSHTYLANVYVDMRRLVDARDQFEAALPLVESAGTPRQRLELLDGYANLNFEMGRIRRAADRYREALALAVAQGDVPTEISIRNNLATVLDRQNCYREALEQLSTVERLLAESPDPRQSLLLLSNRGLVYMDVGERDKARADLVAFLAEAEARGEVGFQHQALINLGYLLEQMGSLERASEYAKRARALAALSQDSRAQREAAILMADIALAQGDAAVTREMCGFARGLDERDGAAALVVHDDIGIASSFAREGRMEEARRGFLAAIPRAVETGQDFLITTALFGAAHTWESQEPDSAAHYYERGLGKIEDERLAAGSQGLRTGFLSGERRFYYEEVARFYARCDRNGEGEWSARAFTTIERAKARGLLDLVDEALRRSPSAEEEAVLDELYALDATTAGQAEKRGRRGQLEQEYVRLRDARGARSLEEHRIATVADVQEHLPANTAMVAYALGDTASLVWAITPSRHECREIADRAEITKRVERLRDAIARPGAGDGALRTEAYALYQALLAPVADELDGATSLVIVPDGKLFELPFEVVLSEAPGEGAGWGDLAFLAKRFDATVVAPSASVWLELAGKASATFDRDLVAFGDPDYKLLASRPSAGGALEPLPFARAEVQAVSAGVSAGRKAVYLGASANESALKRELRGGARIVHLATHGLIDPLDPVSSSVALCPDDGDDGYLHTLEILSVPVNVGLVVLSACESARGRIGRGEGVEGLSRAFIAAGAHAVVASLWPVSDESTATLMKEFYKGMLNDKEPAAEAMRRARLAMLESEKFSHPFYWAPFVVVGTSSAPW